MFLKRIVAAAALSLSVVLTLSACEKATEIKEYSVPESISVSGSAVVAENGQYLLEWDADTACVLLKSKTDGAVWSTVPYDFYLSGEDNSSLNSPIFIQYYNPSDGGLEASKAYSECISEGLMAAETIENGIKLEFYFPNAEITVPLCIELRENSLYAYVNADEIVESGKTKLIELSVLPYLCSTANTDSRDTYVMLPSGCGALCYTDEEVTGISRVYSGDVYGTDLSRKLLDNTYDRETIRIPAYGVKSGENALLAIIEQGSGSARIDADIGNFRNQHSAAYTTFEVRSYDEIEAVRNDYNDERIYASEPDAALTYGIGFYPLSGENADYSGMAEKVREFYFGEKTEKTTQSPYRLNILGGAITKQFFMGVPYDSLTAATTFEQARQMISELSAIATPAVTLTGFGESGTSIRELAGGYKLSGKLGGQKGLNTLEEYCKENGISLFTDFDVIRFTKASNGFNTSYDVAKTASLQKAYYYPLTENLRSPDETQDKIYLLGRTKLEKAINKLSDMDGISGISLASIGELAYSDYSDVAYYSKGSTDKITKLLESLSKEHEIAVAGANAYAARAASVITDVPLQNGANSIFDAEIPFYQLVFGSNAAMYSEAINLATDSRSMLLRAIEMGVSPTFTVCESYDEDFKTIPSNIFYASVYSTLKSDIVDTINRTAEFYEAVKDSYIVSHSVLENSVTESVFSNGVTVTVNHSNKTVQIKDQTLEPYDFSFERKGAAE